MDMRPIVSTLTVAVLCLWTKHAEGSVIRLTGGHGNTTGRVEVSLNGTSWGTVCDDWWTDREAQVVCRRFGFKWGAAFSGAAFGEGGGAIFLENVQCRGNEIDLADCQHNGWGNTTCRHNQDAGVACYNTSVRLISRGRTDAGTVEIRANEGWVEVCDKDWDDSDAKVLCKQMGYADGLAQCCSTVGVDRSGLTSYPYPSQSFSRFRCNGHEEYLTYCAHVELPRRCSPDHLASAICYNTQVSEVRMMRLSRGDHSRGMVQVMQDRWTVLCGEGFGKHEARVVCRHLGFEDGTMLSMGSFGPFYGKFIRPNMECTGIETSIQECNYDKFRTCQKDSPFGYAAVSCFNGSVIPG